MIPRRRVRQFGLTIAIVAVWLASVTTSAPASDDLMHQTFTATSGLLVTLIDPVDGGAAASTSAQLTVQTINGAGVELMVGASVIPYSHIGKRTVDTTTGLTLFTYFGVPLAVGPNALTLTPLGANGLRGTPRHVIVYGPGAPASLTVVARGPLRADGVDRNDILVSARDAYGCHAAQGSVVHIAVVSGDAQLAVPLDPAQPGATPAKRQALDVTIGSDGTGRAMLLAGLTSGDVVLHVAAGDASVDTRVFVAPNLRRPFVDGLITGGLGAVPGNPDEADDEPDGANARRGRIALYGSGAIGNALATFAYDTADTLKSTPSFGASYPADAVDKPFAISGDAGVLHDDALSRDHLYARIDDGSVTALWGEFRANTSGPDATLGGFNQLVDGAQLSLNGQTRRATVFGALNDVGYDRRVFAPTGLANGIVLRPNIVVNSEAVILATVDAHTGAIVAQTPLTRGVDYTLDYATGALVFLIPPTPFDEAFNPHEIVLTYQYASPGSAAKTIGGRVETALGGADAVKLGLGYVNDVSGAGNLALTSQDLSGVFHGGSWSIVHAGSSGQLLAAPDAEGEPTAGGSAAGSALRATLVRAVGADRISMLYENTSAGYDDPFGGLSSPGLLNEAFTYAHTYDRGRGQIALDYGYQANKGTNVGTNTQTTMTLRAHQALTKRFTVTASAQRRVAGAESSTAAATASATPVPAQTSTQLSLGADWHIAPKVDLTANRLQTIGGNDAVQPTQTDAQIGYAIGSSTQAYLRERWTASPIASFADATQSYTASTGGTRATEFGITQRISAATSVDEAYVIDQDSDGTSVYATTGIHERFRLFAKLAGDGFFQHALSTGDASTGGGFDLYGVSLNYAAPGGAFKLSGSSQLRTGTDAGLSFSLAALGAISPEFSLFASANDARAVNDTTTDERVGLAWRPAQSQAGVTLLQYEVNQGTAELTGTSSGVLSLEQVVHIRTNTEVDARYAYKLDGDASYAAHTSLAALRVDQRVGAMFDIGTELRESNIADVAGTKATAIGVEGGVRLGNTTRVGAGYNFSGTADPSLSQTPVHKGAYLTVTSVIDRVFGWGKA